MKTLAYIKAPKHPHYAFYRSLVAAFLLSAAQTPAALIDFETTPSGLTPTDNSALSDPYAIEGGGTVRFFFDVNSNRVFDSGVDLLPDFEMTGNDPIGGFTSAQVGANLEDTARPGFEGQLGNFFLRPPAGGAPPSGPFIVRYDTAQMIREFSGEIWDIDGGNQLGTEQWQVDALDASGFVLGSLTSPEGGDSGANSLDSLPWDFAFTNLPDGLQAVRVTFIGTKTGNLGLAFNNFSAATALPEPSSAALLLCGAAICLRRRPLRTHERNG